MKIELKNIRHIESMSEETNCYSATVYVDGAKVGEVSNNGHGGCDNQRIDNAMLDRLNGWCRENLPPHDFSKFGMAPMPRDFESYCGTLVNEWLIKRDFKKDLSRNVLLRRPNQKSVVAFALKQKGKVWPMNTMIAALAKREPEGTVFLNLLSLDEALEIYRQGA